MLRWPKRGPSHPTVVAYLALFVALCGTSLAAIRPSGGTGEQERGPEAVQARGQAAVPARHVARRGPRGPRGFRGRRGRRGLAGAAGPAGSAGAQGPQGPPGLTRFVVREAGVPAPPAGADPAGPSGANAFCLDGEVATGGGFSGPLSGSAVTSSSPSAFISNGQPFGWFVQFSNYVEGRRAYVVCAAP